jgi:glycosyltransferase involved in cell wall biosynthesis
MRNDKEQATILRKEGWSYRRLIKKLGIPRATLSDWFGHKKWSQDIKNSLNQKNLGASRARIIRLDKIRGENLKQIYKQAREEALEDFEKLKHHPLFVAGVMIYWGEGDKASKHGFRVTNSDPLLVKIFLEFLRKICLNDEKRIRAWVLIYPDLNASSCENYWSKQLGLSRKNFTKSIMIQGRHKTKKVVHGICTLSYSSRFLKEKMLVWMSLLAEDFLEK